MNMGATCGNDENPPQSQSAPPMPTSLEERRQDHQSSERADHMIQTQRAPMFPYQQVAQFNRGPMPPQQVIQTMPWPYMSPPWPPFYHTPPVASPSRHYVPTGSTRHVWTTIHLCALIDTSTVIKVLAVQCEVVPKFQSIEFEK